MLILRAWSLDLVRSCLGFRAFWPSDDFLGRGRWMGGRVVDRPGGDCDMMEGKSSLGRGEWKGLSVSCLNWLCKGGKSKEGLVAGRRESWPDLWSYGQLCQKRGMCRHDHENSRRPIPTRSLRHGCAAVPGSWRPTSSWPDIRFRAAEVEQGSRSWPGRRPCHGRRLPSSAVPPVPTVRRPYRCCRTSHSAVAAAGPRVGCLS